MKRFLAALSLLALPLAGCAGLYGSPGHPGGYGGVYDDDEDYYEGSSHSQRTPLDAQLYESHGGLRVNLNRRAYVAIFEIEPGRGMGLLYPAYSGERSLFDAGYSRVSFTSSRPYRWYLDSDPLGHYNRYPRYFLLVASRRPLRLSHIHDSRGSMRSLMGYQGYHSLNANRIMNDLIDQVLVPQRDEDWDSDVVTMWPNGRDYSRYGYGNGYGDYGWDNDPSYWDRLVYVRCPDGRVRTVPSHQLHYACGTYRDPRHPRNPRNPPPVRPDTTHRDSIRRPGQRRPGAPGSAGDETRGGGIARPGGVPGGVDRPRVGETDGQGEDVPRIDIRRRRFEEVEGRGATGGTRPGTDAGRPRAGETEEETPRVTPRAGGFGRPRAAEPQGTETGGAAAPASGEGGRAAPRGEGAPVRPRVRSEEPSRPAERPRLEPRTPREQPREEPAAEPRRPERREEPRAEPRPEPRSEPRREEPRQEPRAEPRREQPRSEPRREQPRAEPRREEPRQSSPPPQQSTERRGRPDAQ